MKMDRFAQIAKKRSEGGQSPPVRVASAGIAWPEKRWAEVGAAPPFLGHLSFRCAITCREPGEGRKSNASEKIEIFTE
jgi:hypothetical protein